MLRDTVGIPEPGKRHSMGGGTPQRPQKLRARSGPWSGESAEDTSCEKPSSLWKQFSLKINSFSAQLERTSCPLRMCPVWEGRGCSRERGGEEEVKGGAHGLQRALTKPTSALEVSQGQSFQLSALQPPCCRHLCPSCPPRWTTLGCGHLLGMEAGLGCSLPLV